MASLLELQDPQCSIDIDDIRALCDYWGWRAIQWEDPVTHAEKLDAPPGDVAFARDRLAYWEEKRDKWLNDLIARS
jgi:hypothetical protein